MQASWSIGDKVRVSCCAPHNDNVGVIVGPSSSVEYPVSVKLSFATINFHEREFSPLPPDYVPLHQLKRTADYVPC